MRQALVRDRPASVDLGEHPSCALLCRHREAIDKAIALITAITLTITLITLTITLITLGARRPWTIEL